MKLFSQNDSIPHSRDFLFREGVYLSYNDFRNNQPIGRNALVSREDPTLLEFIAKCVIDKEILTYTLEGTEQKVKCKDLFGFCQNNTFYFFYDKSFYRLPVFGNLSHFIVQIEVYRNASSTASPNYYDYGMTATNMPVKTTEIKQFIFDFYNNLFIPFNLEEIEILLKRDQEIYTEFMAQVKKKRKETMMFYLRRYNLKHPPLFPAN